jgi:HlyD family secretion protein
MKLAFFIGPLALGFVVTSAVVVGRQLTLTSPTVARTIGSPLPVRVVEAKQANLTESIGANGDVQPIALVNLTARLAVRVEKIPVDLGDVVTPRQVLMRFDRALPKAAVAAAQAAMEQAASARGRALQQFRRVKTIYEQGLSNAILATAQSALDQAAGDVVRAEDNCRRIKAIVEQQLLPKVDLEKAQAVVEETRARYKQAEEKLWRARKDLQTELERAQATVEDAQARYQRVAEDLLHAKQDLQHTTLVSPVSGIVMERQVNAGETPRLDQPLLTLGQIDHVLVEAQIAEDRVKNISIKQAAIMTFSAFPNDEFEGEIVKINPVTDPKTRTFLVYIKLANPELKLKPGLSSFVRIKQEHRGLAVPSISLINPTGVRESSVFVVEHGSAARLRRVKIGVVSDGMTQIVEGLAAGELVVTVGHLYLKDEDQVRIGDEFDDLKSKLAGAPPPTPNSLVKSY